MADTIGRTRLSRCCSAMLLFDAAMRCCTALSYLLFGASFGSLIGSHLEESRLKKALDHGRPSQDILHHPYQIHKESFPRTMHFSVRLALLAAISLPFVSMSNAEPKLDCVVRATFCLLPSDCSLYKHTYPRCIGGQCCKDPDIQPKTGKDGRKRQRPTAFS